MLGNLWGYKKNSIRKLDVDLAINTEEKKGLCFLRFMDIYVHWVFLSNVNAYNSS